MCCQWNESAMKSQSTPISPRWRTCEAQNQCETPLVLSWCRECWQLLEFSKSVCGCVCVWTQKRGLKWCCNDFAAGCCLLCASQSPGSLCLFMPLSLPLSHTHTHTPHCTSIFMRAFKDIWRSPAPYPKPNHHNWLRNVNPDPNRHLNHKPLRLERTGKKCPHFVNRMRILVNTQCTYTGCFFRIVMSW